MQPQCDSAGAAPSAHWHRQSVDKGLAVHLSAGESVPEHYDKQNDSRRQRASEHCGRGERRARIGRRLHSAPMAATLHHARELIGTVGSAVCWINHKTTPFDNLYRGMEKESQKISSERRRNRRDRKSAQAKIRALEVSTRDRGGSLRVRRRNKQYSSEPCPDQVTSTTNGRPNRTNQPRELHLFLQYAHGGAVCSFSQ